MSAAQSASPHLVVNTYRLNVRSGPGIGHSIITSVPGGTTLPALMIGHDRKWYQVTSPVGPGWVNTSYTVGRGDFSGLPWAGAPSNLASGGHIASGAAHVVVNTSYLNVRRGPGLGHDVLATVPGGTTLAVTAIDQSGKWLQVQTGAGSGWLRASYAIPRGDFASVPRQGAVSAPTVGDTPQPDVDDSVARLVVNASYLNVRTGPGVGHSVLIVVPGGAELPVLLIAPDRNWYQVQTTAGPGWVNSRYTVGRGSFAGAPVAVDPLTGDVPRVVVNTSNLNVRSGPGISYGVVAVTPGGTTLKVVGISGDRKWFQVEGSFGTGWLRNRYAAFRGDISRVPTV